MNMYICIVEYVYKNAIPRIWTAIRNALHIKMEKHFFNKVKHF